MHPLTEYPIMSAPQNQATRLTQLDAAVTAVATQLGDFIKESKEHRQRTEADQAQLWAAIREQGNQHSAAIKEQGLQHSAAVKEQGLQLQAAVEKLSSKGQISWPAIIATVSMLVTLIGAGAGVGWMLMESRITQVDNKLEYAAKICDAEQRVINARIDGMDKVNALEHKKP